MQDAGKQRPYYGRGFSAWESFPRKSDVCPVRWTWPDTNVYRSAPPTQVRVVFT